MENLRREGRLDFCEYIAVLIYGRNSLNTSLNRQNDSIPVKGDSFKSPESLERIG